ncbi:MAG: tRNA epoxyqueuosine(34) reductase QueG [Aestuariivita sp.]|nr:tRNA epoxyqueuosine(34) reductase QueG [Aestuariivita sp.]
MDEFKYKLIERAREEGFVAAGVCSPDAVPDFAQRFAVFLRSGYHGEMNWLERRVEWRSDPKTLWREVRSIVMLAESYTPASNPLRKLNWRDRGVISVYAQNKDYHAIVKKRLKRLAHWMIREAGGEVKVFVDTAPVPEKALGQAAGLGWQGKHTNLLSRSLGNWFFLGSIFSTLELSSNLPEISHCGSCKACLDICPTKAFIAPYQLDARRCISYLTIEHRGPVEKKLRPLLGNRIYGCDDCLAVCPWNKFAVKARDVRFSARSDLEAPRLADLLKLTDSSFREMFSGSPIKRIGRDRFVRNVLYAVGNSAKSDLSLSVKVLIEDSNPVVAEAANWALEQLKAREK